MKNEELMKIDLHKKIILQWEQELKIILKQNIKKTMELFPIDKKWFQNYKRALFSAKL